MVFSLTIRVSTLILLLAFVVAALPMQDGSTPSPVQSSSSLSSMDWRITGPAGGDVRSLVIDPQDPQRLYLGTLDGQIYTSTDGGTQWARLAGFNRSDLYIDHIIVDPRSSQTIYVAAHRHKEPGGFFKSTDGGQTWREAELLKGEALHSLTQAPSNPDILIAGTNRGLFRSPDGGETWEQLPTSAYADLINIESLAFDPRTPDTIYAGTWHLPWKTTDGGKNWKSIKTGMIDDSDVFAIEVDQLEPNHVIASACSGIYESHNAGANWRKVQGIPSTSRRTRAITQHPSIPNLVFAGTTEGFWRSTTGGDSWKVIAIPQTPKKLEINSIAVHSKNPQTVYIGTNNYGVMMSRDGGKTFSQTNTGFSGRRTYSILPDSEKPNRIYATTINTATGGGFFFISDDSGATWQSSMGKMPSNLIAYSILQDRGDSNRLYLGTNLGLYTSLDRGVSWTLSSAPPAPAVRKKKGRRGRGSAVTATAATVTRADVVAGGGDSTVVVKHAQEALNGAGYDVGAPDGAAGTRTVAAIRKFQTSKGVAVSGKLDAATLAALGLGGGMLTSAEAAGTAPMFLSETINSLAHFYDQQAGGRIGLLAATNVGLYRSFDPTKGWEKLSYGGELDSRTLCISTNKENIQTIWVGTAKSGVLLSRDGGATWQQIQHQEMMRAPINIIEQDPQQPKRVYVGTAQTFYISHDDGAQWMRRGGDLPIGSYTSILISPRNSDELFVGNAHEKNGGVFHSTDAGMTWRRVDPELPSRRIRALAFDARDSGRIFVGSHSAGIYIAERNAQGSATSSVEK